MFYNSGVDLTDRRVLVAIVKHDLRLTINQLKEIRWCLYNAHWTLQH